MCGIAGMVCKNGMIDDNLVKEMLGIIAYRGPDDEGIYKEEKLALGHRRLSILDLSQDGKQPMNYLSRYWITFNGEIYNYIELRKKLANYGYQFKTKTDTEVILAAYDQWKNQCVKYFNGMWSFCIYDRKEQILFCSRDRFGIKPFYYIDCNEHFAFGSEIKQVLLTMKEAPVVNHDVLAGYLVCCELDYSEETMFKNVYQLMGGYNLIYRLKENSFSIEKWYELYHIKEKNRTMEENASLFRDKFENSIHLRLRSDVPVGFCLSGGLDSSSIVCMTNDILKREGLKTDLHTVSSCFEDKQYDEQEYIDAVIENTGVYNHKVFPDMNELFKNLDQMIWHMDEPVCSTSVFAQWNVYREAKRQGLTVMLDGQGSDEMLAGYTAFYDLLFKNLFARGKFICFLHEISCYQKLRSKADRESILFHLEKIFAEILLPNKAKEKMRNKRKGYDCLFSEELLNNQYAKGIRKERVLFNPRKYIYQSLFHELPALLHYEDRNSMAYSIEARLPFLDYQLVEAVFSMPFQHKIKDGITKRVMREGLKDILPKKITNRYSKLGFCTPEDKWMEENKKVIREELKWACNRLSPLLEEDKVLRCYDEKKLLKSDTVIWRIICAARWAELFKVKIE